MSRNITSKKSAVSKIILPDHVLAYIQEEVKKPDVSTQFLKKFGNYVNWDEVINAEIRNESSFFLPAFIYFMNNIKLAKPWLRKKVEKHTEFCKTLKQFRPPIHFSLNSECEQPEKLLLRNYYLQPYRPLEATPNDERHMEVILSVYLLLRIKFEKQNEVCVVLPEVCAKIRNYLDHTKIAKVCVNNSKELALHKYQECSYIGGGFWVDIEHST
jgi:hypothetical protein